MATPGLLPGKSHGQRSLVGFSPWGREESNTTERLHVHFSLSCIGGGNGSPLQYSCLENCMGRPQDDKKSDTAEQLTLSLSCNITPCLCFYLMIWCTPQLYPKLHPDSQPLFAFPMPGCPVINTAAAAANSLQSCPTLCDPTDGSPPGSAVPGILQARTLEWAAISSSNV